MLHGNIIFDSIIEILVSNPSIMAGKALLLTVGLLLSLALLLYMDRKVWAAVQMRRGPNVVGPFWIDAIFSRFRKVYFLKKLLSHQIQINFFFYSRHF